MLEMSVPEWHREMPARIYASMWTTKISECSFGDAPAPASPPLLWLRRALRVLARRGRSSPAAGQPASAPLTFPEDATCSLLVRRLPFRISCVEGCLWITHDADPRDHVLCAGQEFTASGPGQLVIHAFATSHAVVWTYSPVPR